MGSEEVILAKPFETIGKVEHVTREAAEASIVAEFEKAKAVAIKAGCEIDENGYIIPINAATGKPDYTAQRTIKWAEVEEDSGKYYVKPYMQIEQAAIEEEG